MRDRVRRLLLSYVEGIYLFKTRPRLVYAVMEEAGIQDAAVQKDLHDRGSESMREYPVPEANGIQGAMDSLAHPNARTLKPPR